MRTVALAALLVLAGCAAEQPVSVTQRDTVAACRARADEIYNRLNRGAIYSISQSGLPNSSTGLVGNPNAHLQAQYEHEQRIDRCVHDTGAGTLTVGPSAPGPSGAAAHRK